MGISLSNLPNYVKELGGEVERLKNELHRVKIETVNEVHCYGTTIHLLEEYKQNKPTMEELGRLKKERDACLMELRRERLWKKKAEEYKANY